jgi:enoyl-CoA hydratase/carnithine racemase
MENGSVILKTEDRVSVLTLNQPDKLNAMDDAMARDFQKAISTVKADPDTKALIVTGSGKAFSAGGNLQKMSDMANTPPIANTKATLAFYMSFLCIRDLNIPTIAAINGAAIGAGACLPLACDMRLASKNSKIGFTFAKIGLHPGMGAEFFLSRIIGTARTFELLMTGDIITAEEAYRIGLINHVVEPEELMTRAMKLARQIVGMPVFPIRTLKETIYSSLNTSLDDVLRKQAAYQAICYTGGDIKEGITSFLEKRGPDFRDEY